MIEIWGRRNSSNVIPVLWAVAETGVDFCRHDVGGSFGGLDSPDYLAMNPNGLVPTLVDDGLVLWESNAIIRYVAAKYGAGGLWDSDPARRSLADRWMDWAKSTANPAAMGLFWATVRTEPGARDPAAIARLTEATTRIWQFLDAHLAGQPYLAGDRLTMGDLPLGALAHRYFQMDVERPDLPHVRAWYERLCARPAYAEHCMIDFGANPAEWLALERAGANPD
ncbi:MAG: glutathione S-transferase [Proteobacteria bacterium]|nr:glutathione S-transferase [Pseudomonadota bacterium]